MKSRKCQQNIHHFFFAKSGQNKSALAPHLNAKNPILVLLLSSPTRPPLPFGICRGGYPLRQHMLFRYPLADRISLGAKINRNIIYNVPFEVRSFIIIFSHIFFSKQYPQA